MLSTCCQNMVSAWGKMSGKMFSRPEKHRKEPATLGQTLGQTLGGWTKLHSWQELPGVLGEIPEWFDFRRCFFRSDYPDFLKRQSRGFPRQSVTLALPQCTETLCWR